MYPGTRPFLIYYSPTVSISHMLNRKKKAERNFIIENLVNERQIPFIAL